MRFLLTIDLGNAEMQTPANVAEALKDAAHSLYDRPDWNAPVTLCEHWMVRDTNGNTCGNYQFTADEIQPEPAPAGTVNLLPKGCETPEGCARVNSALEAFQASTAAYASAAAQFLKDNRAALGAPIPKADAAELSSQLADVEELNNARQDAQEEFLRAVCGAPPAPFRYSHNCPKCGGKMQPHEYSTGQHTWNCQEASR